MAFHLPLLAGLRAARTTPHASATTQPVPLRQFPSRPRQRAGGSLHQETSSPAPALQQQSAPARQRTDSSLRQSIIRLREKLYLRARRPASPVNTAPRETPTVPQRNTPEPGDIPPLHPPGEPQTRPSRRRHLLEPIAEESGAALQESALNTMQQRAWQAAQEDTAQQPASLRPQFAALELTDNGTLHVRRSASENLTAILNETLARPQHRWLAHEASADDCQHVLMDPGGKLFSLQGSPTAVIGLTSSRAMPAWRQQSAAQRLAVLPDSTLQALLTGIFSHDRELSSSDKEDEGREKERVSEQLREHNGRLYRLNEAGLRWEQVDKDEEKTYGKLSKQPDAMLYAIYDKKTLHNLSTGEKSAKAKGKITAYCADGRGGALLVLSDEKTAKQSVMRLPTLGAKKEAQQALALMTEDEEGNSRAFHTTGIALHDGNLFALDSQGQLYRGAAPRPGDTQLLLRKDDAATAQLSAQLGGRYTLSGLVAHGDGQLHAVAKSRGDQKHFCTLDSHGAWQAQWNMSESLVLDHHAGLLQPRPLAQERIDLGRLGQLAVYEGKIYARDSNSGRWEASQEKAQSLKRAQDGSGWALNDGLPARVKVSQKSDKIDGAHHRFALRQLKTSLALELPLPGFDAQNKARAIAPLDSEHCAAITENNELQYHRTLAGTRQAEKMMQTLSKAGIDNWLPHIRAAADIPAQGEGNTLSDITTDQQQRLYVLDQQGKLYQMAEEEWRAAPGTRPDARWQPVTLPPELGPIAQLHNAAGGALMVADKAGRSAILQLANTPLDAGIPVDGNDEESEAFPSGNAMLNRRNAQQVTAQNRWLILADFDPHAPPEALSRRPEGLKAVERLDEASKSVNVRGMTLKYETSIAGMTGRDGNHVNSRLRDRLGAHLFNTRLSTPRPLKSAWYAAQHSWQGREGLRSLYAQQAWLHQQMQTLRQQPAPDDARQPLQQRIAGLGSGSFDRRFIAQLKTLSDNVADSAAHHASLLGQHSGALRGDGSENSRYSPSQLRAVTQAMNPWSDEQNLLPALAAIYQRYPLREDNMLSRLQAQGVAVRHQKAQPPLGRQRDPHDDMGLVKSRLILDGLMMAALHELLDQMTACGDNPTEIAAIKERFRQLRDEEYGDNLVLRATSQGFTSNMQLEACYDAIKTMIHAFSKPHHGLNVTTRTVLKAPDQQEMSTQLLRTLKALESGESMGFGRNYGGMVTLSVIPGGDVIGIPGVRGNLDRAYNASFARGDNGINVTFSRNGGGTGTVFGAVGWNPLSQIPDSASLKTDLGGNRSIAPSARLGAVVAMAIQRQLQNSVSFTLSEAELKPFIEQLIQGTLNPNQLLEKGVSHKVKNGTTLSFNVDAAAVATMGGGLRFPTNSSDPKKNSAVARVSGNAQIGANILSAQSERSVTRSAAGSSRSDSDNRLRMFNTASASAGIAGGMGVTAQAAAKLRIPMFGINSTSIQASIDNRTKHSMSLDIAKAEPIHAAQLDKLIEQVGSNFDDPQTNKLLQEIKDADKPPEKAKPALSANLKALRANSLSARATGEGRPLSKTEREALETLRKASDNSPDTKEEKFSTFMLDEEQATARKLDKLLTHLLALTPANNGQYGVICSARQLNTQRQALALHCQALNSAEYQSTYNNLRKVDSNNLMHVVHSLFASELPESAAEAISRFMEEKPLLKEVIRELQQNRNTQAVVTLELIDERKFELQRMWLHHETQPEAIQAMLRDRTNLRVKSIAFSETDTKQEGINVPLFVAGGASAASVSISRNLGKINFSYGIDQHTPTAFTLEGEAAWAKPSLVEALTQAEIQDKRGRV